MTNGTSRGKYPHAASTSFLTDASVVGSTAKAKLTAMNREASVDPLPLLKASLLQDPAGGSTFGGG
jgi:hypothetical protein